jgi:hypothetical protein
MRATHIRLQNFRSFADSGVIELAGINVLIGANNAGKSSILRGLHQIQQGLNNQFADVRIGSTKASVEIGLEDGANHAPITGGVSDPVTLMITLESKDRRGGGMSMQRTTRQGGGGSLGNPTIPSTEPHHFIVPFLSKRKAVSYQQDISEQHVKSVTPDVSFLAAKLSRLGNPAFPSHEGYATACKAILGFTVAAIPSPNGQLPGIYLPDGQTLPIDQLGEGVPNIVHFLASLAVSRGKLFLVEEPENDLHPQALKALLDLVIKSSEHNQFVISTHSNIVVRHLCSENGSNLYRINPKSATLPVESEIQKVPDSPDARLAVLSELGYSLSDFELWDGWFFPTLSRLRTISANGASKVSATFEDLNRLFLFTHLTPAYREASWVVVDGDEAGRSTIEKLRTKFTSHSASRFKALSQPAFERYYPAIFAEKTNEALSIQQEGPRREAKKKLLHEVMAWLDSDKARGVEALQSSAAEVISVLTEIDAALTSRKTLSA